MIQQLSCGQATKFLNAFHAILLENAQLDILPTYILFTASFFEYFFSCEFRTNEMRFEDQIQIFFSFWPQAQSGQKLSILSFKGRTG